VAAINATAPAAIAKRHTSMSLVGEPKFAHDFKHFDWVNPNAPQGGRIRLVDIGGFDSLNPYTIKGNPAPGLASLLVDHLFEQSLDEPSTAYPLVAQWVSYPDDYSSVTFGLRAQARFHDGEPIKPEDVIFSLEALRKANPHYALYYKNVVKAEKTGDREVTFRFDMAGNRELPFIVGELPVLPKHYWTAVGPTGEPRDLSKTTLEPPLGSGAYRIKLCEAQRTVVYERVPDYWAKDLPVRIGQNNFDEIQYVAFRDRVPAFEAFKTGQIDFWVENSAKGWATGFDFPAAASGMVKREKIGHKRPAPMQAFALNLRRPVFQDRRVRLAFNLAFDFEWANKNVFFDQYKRISSYFGNTELSSTGLPQGRELEILEGIRAQVPAEVFTSAYQNPVNVSPEDIRNNMRKAQKLLQEAGWTLTEKGLVNPAGERMTVEFLIAQPDFERIISPYKANLERLGINVSMRVLETAQYAMRVKTFDFDIIVNTIAQSNSPGNEQREYWGSRSADQEGSRNRIGIKDPAIDTLIDRIIAAPNRAELIAATHALDRVLLWNYFVVPQWYLNEERLSYWDKLGRPPQLPSQTYAFPQAWWYDATAAAKLAEARK